MADVKDTKDPESAEPSALRAWCYMVVLSWRRQARAHGMLWLALALLGLTMLIVGVQTSARGWTFRQFSRGPVMLVYVVFLLPLWTLSFATEALGRERAAQNLIWLLSRPLSRPAIFLGKYLAVLPWCLTLNLGGFALICSVAGPAGLEALEVYWPALIGSTLLYAALFHGLGALVRRPAMLALLYAFFFEMIVGLMPGHLKRLSVTYYTRCIALERGQQFDPTLELRNFEAVSAGTAWLVLLLATTVLLAVGAWVFSRGEYLDSV
jgi:ABC-type transport system involved in multi-copper enzyme maturation permease subunit